MINALLGCLYGIISQDKKALEALQKLKELSNEQYGGLINQD
ncbi:MAG TPA: hypothetical protein VFI29_22630 [Hanamia sp.]|nr:hypothetical protein [Hanamia sp.]